MMKYYRCLVLILVLPLFLPGCQSVSSLNPVGDKPVKTPSSMWTGSWVVNDEDVLHTKVIDADKGELLIAIVDLSRDNKADYLELYNVSVRKSDKNFYFNLQEPDSDISEYFFARFTRDGNTIKVYAPSYDFFSKLVSSGRIKGVVNKDSSSVVLSGTGSDLTTQIDRHPECFDTENVSVLRKLGQ